jgi:hypothetical protein
MRSIALLCLLCVLAGPGIAADKYIYPDGVTTTFEPNDAASEKKGVKSCQLSITPVKLPQGVDLRVKILMQGQTVFYVLTVDVGEFTVSNGIPYDPKKRPITSFKIISNIFETGPQMKLVDMHDGGMGMALDQTSFMSMLTLVQRGDYLIAFKPVGALDETVYVVRPGADQQPMSQFAACLRQM